jgi:hypothetical protein
MISDDLPPALRDQAEAAIRDAGAWVDANEHVSGWMPAEDLAPPFWNLHQAWLGSDPETHATCEHITGPQPVHWFPAWPQQVWCNNCAVRKMRRLGRRKHSCLGCGKATREFGELTTGNLIAHGPVCDACVPVP